MRNENSFALNENKCKDICHRGKFRKAQPTKNNPRRNRKSKTVREIFSLKTFAKKSK